MDTNAGGRFFSRCRYVLDVWTGITGSGFSVLAVRYTGNPVSVCGGDDISSSGEAGNRILKAPFSIIHGQCQKFFMGTFHAGHCGMYCCPGDFRVLADSFSGSGNNSIYPCFHIGMGCISKVRLERGKGGIDSVICIKDIR